MNLNVTRVDTKIGLACSMLYYIYLCKYVLIFISDNGIKGGRGGGLSAHRTGLNLQLLNVPVLSDEPLARVFVCLFLTFVFFVRMKSSLGYFLVVLVYPHSFSPCLGAHADRCSVWVFVHC
jgi:hypothetical protein